MIIITIRIEVVVVVVVVMGSGGSGSGSGSSSSSSLLVGWVIGRHLKSHTTGCCRNWSWGHAHPYPSLPSPPLPIHYLFPTLLPLPFIPPFSSPPLVQLGECWVALQAPQRGPYCTQNCQTPLSRYKIPCRLGGKSHWQTGWGWHGRIASWISHCTPQTDIRRTRPNPEWSQEQQAG